MKKVMFLSVVLMFLTTIASADNTVGWLWAVTLDGRTVQVGANNNGFGFAVANQNYVGTHIGIDANGYLQVRVFAGATTPMAENIYLWNNSAAPLSGMLSWKWRNYDPSWLTYKPGEKPTDINATATLIGPWGSPIYTLDPNGGNMIIPLTQYADYDSNGWRIVFTANIPPIPEPGSFLVLGSGLVGLVGLGPRRRK